MFSLLPAFLSGIFAGTLTGLIPGIHINLISTILLSSPLLIFFSPEIAIIFIIAMAITHTFIDFIPSIYLGAPDEDTGLATLPGHKFLIKGRGHEAIKLTLIGSTIAISTLIIVIPLFFFLLPTTYSFINQMMAWFLIWISILLLYLEKSNKMNSIIIFVLAGFLGIASLNLNVNQPLLPLLTGLFGSSTIIYSIKNKTKIPKQKIEKLILPKKELIKPTISTTLISPICSLFPGLGSSQAAIIGSSITKNINKKQFLILLGSVNTLVMATSFITLILLNKTRTGAANAVSQIAKTNPHLTIILITILASTLISVPLTIFLSRKIAKNIHKINYSKISITILIFLTILIAYFSKTSGLLVFLVSTSLGLTSIHLGVRRGFLMGSLLIPTILLYLPF